MASISYLGLNETGKKITRFLNSVLSHIEKIHKFMLQSNVFLFAFLLLLFFTVESNVRDSLLLFFKSFYMVPMHLLGYVYTSQGYIVCVYTVQIVQKAAGADRAELSAQWCQRQTIN